MPVFFKETNSDELVAAINNLAATMTTLNLQMPELMKVSIPSMETPPPEPDEILMTGSGEMSLIFTDKTGVVYPTELQPQLSPSANVFQYRQLSKLDSLYQISGNYLASNIQQIPVSTLESYNTENGTSFVEETRERLIVPLVNESNVNIPLSFAAQHEWTNVNNNNVIEWLEPVFAVWKANSDIIELQYRRGEYALLFGNNQRWDVNLSFRGIISLPSASISE